MRETIGLLLIGFGVFVFFVGILGTMRFSYILSRLHSTAVGDTSGVVLIILGLIVYGTPFFLSLKLLLVVLFLWLSGSVATHFIARVECLTNEEYEMYDMYEKYGKHWKPVEKELAETELTETEETIAKSTV
ncbi:MAG: monovalent cation/H(+) antiporter subunit G [Bacillota bacterium]